MSSFTVSLTGNTSKLSCVFFPEIVLDEKYNYSCGLLDLTTYHSIPNITDRNNKLYYANGEYFNIIEVPVGCYEAEDVLNYIKSELSILGISFEFIVNKNTLKTTIVCEREISCEGSESIHGVFGFRVPTIPAKTKLESDDVIKISKLNVIRVECNIVSGAYVNGGPCHSIYEFASNKVDVGYKIVEQPKNVIYMPVTPKRINYIDISIVDQDGNLIDFRGEDITCRIHIKRDNK